MIQCILQMLNEDPERLSKTEESPAPISEQPKPPVPAPQVRPGRKIVWMMGDPPMPIEFSKKESKKLPIDSDGKKI